MFEFGLEFSKCKVLQTSVWKAFEQTVCCSKGLPLHTRFCLVCDTGEKVCNNAISTWRSQHWWKNIYLPVKEHQTGILPSIVASMFCSAKFHLNCNIVNSIVDNPLEAGSTLQKASLDHKTVK